MPYVKARRVDASTLRPGDEIRWASQHEADPSTVVLRVEPVTRTVTPELDRRTGLQAAPFDVQLVRVWHSRGDSIGITLGTTDPVVLLARRGRVTQADVFPAQSAESIKAERLRGLARDEGLTV